MKRILPVIICLLTGYQALAQSPGQTNVTIFIKDVYTKLDEDPARDEYRWNVWLDDVLKVNCIKKKGDPGWYRGINAYLSSNATYSSIPNLKIKAEHWDEDNCGGDCGYNRKTFCGDNGQCLQEKYLNLYDFAPGLYDEHDVKYCGNGSNENILKLRFFYRTPVPNTPKLYPDGTLYNVNNQICAGLPLTVKTGTGVKSTFHSQITYTWEYHINGETENYEVSNPNYCADRFDDDRTRCTQEMSNLGRDPSCCWEPKTITNTRPRWRSLTTTQANISNGDINLSSISSLAGISGTSNKSVKFRVKATANGSASIGYSESIYLNVSMYAPTFASLSSSPSCSGDIKDGAITINSISGGSGNFRYNVLLKSVYDNVDCSNPLSSNCISATYATGTSTSRNITVGNLPPGEYVVQIANAGGGNGNCFTAGTKVVGVKPTPQINSTNVSQISCYGAGDGQIKVSASSGSGTLSYSINSGPFVTSNTFSSLSANTYSVIVKDQCDITRSTGNITITEPTQVSGTFTTSPSDCFNPFNGTVQIDVDKGSGQYNYTLLKDGSPVRQLTNSSAKSWTVNGLSNGTYGIDVRDAVLTSCTGYSETFTFTEPIPLSLAEDTVTPITCFEASDGAVTMIGSGGSGNLIYTLTHSVSGQIYTSTDGNFTGLPGGDYTASVKNNNSCNDEMVLSSSVSVYEPDLITIDIDVKNISCYGADDATLTATVLGGNSGNSYQWEFYDSLNAKWADYNMNGEGTGTKLNNLFPTYYRLSVADKKNCSQVSAEMLIANPPSPLKFTAVDIDNPGCKGDTDGVMSPVVSGGWGDYVYEYSNDEKTTWTTFDENTYFGIGKYYLRVTDPEGCTVELAQPIDFVQPDQPLVISLEETKRNGYSLSCFESGDGTVLISGTGGIPFSENTYLYAVDNDNFQSNGLYSNLNAGDHTFYIKDANGCVQDETLTLTQPAPLVISLVEKGDVKCFGDDTGFIEVEASGGVEPLTYSINGISYVSRPRFEDITAGTYEVTVRDKNMCVTPLAVEIIGLFNPIEISIDKTDVFCFAYNTGEIRATVTGDSPPFSYEWEGSTETSSTLSNITAGEYYLKVTDQEGCFSSTNVVIEQPDNINLGGWATICEDQDYPLDATYPSGIKYEWSSDNGFTSNKAKVNLTREGNYILVLALDDGCVMTDEFELKKSDVKFEVNFLGATEAVLGDTIRMIEVCYPAPEHVSWDFGAQAKIFADDSHRPQISFDEPGEYIITLTASYSGCTDSLSKQVIFFTPDEKPNNSGRIALGEVGIKAVELYPNPSDGRFTMIAYLHQIEDLRVFVYDLYGNEVAGETGTEDARYRFDFNLIGLRKGIYIMKLVTSSDTRDLRLVIK